MSESSFENITKNQLTENDIINFLDSFINKHSDEILNKEEKNQFNLNSKKEEKPPINPFFNIKLNNEIEEKTSDVKNKKEIKKEKKVPINKLKNNHKTMDFQRQSIIYNDCEYVFTTNLYKHPNSHHLIKPIFKMKQIDLINKLFENEKNIMIKPLTETLFHIKIDNLNYIFYYVTINEVLSNGFKDYFRYYLLKTETENSPTELKKFLQVENCIEAQPYYMFEINVQTKKENDGVYKYYLADKIFDFISKSLSNKEQSIIVKEYIKNDPDYILESIINKNFLQIVFANGNKIINI